jgi:hypothetical protein
MSGFDRQRRFNNRKAKTPENKFTIADFQKENFLNDRKRKKRNERNRSDICFNNSFDKFFTARGFGRVFLVCFFRHQRKSLA